MQKFVIFILSFCLISFNADAQFGNRRKSLRYEIIGGLGATNFLGDLGGANRFGTHGFKDLEWVFTRPATSISLRLPLSQYFSLKNNLCWGMVRGDDQQTYEIFRHNRNLNFRSAIWELSTQFEIHFVRGQLGHVFKIAGVRGMKRKQSHFYLFGGAGLFYFNPKGEWNGKWYALAPLHTEGVSYSRISGMVSVGGGVHFAISSSMDVGFEFGIRQTFTDYIDDVSTVYPNPSIFNGNAIAVHFSNPALSTPMPPTLHGLGCQTCAGMQRGDPAHKDAYMFGMFNLGYKVGGRKQHFRSKF